MRYRLRTLLILLALGPPLVAGVWWGIRPRPSIFDTDVTTGPVGSMELEIRPELRDGFVAGAEAAPASALVSRATLSLADEDPQDLRVKEIVDLIASMPDWPFTPVVANKDRTERAEASARQIEAIAHSIASYDDREIREAFRRVAAKGGGGSSQRLFILNQFLFAIPEDVPRESPVRNYLLAGYLALPESAASSNSWPWTRDEEGNWKFSIRAHGIQRMGPPYPALDIFDGFSKEFGRRPLKE
jgi:hypothetical protein